MSKVKVALLQLKDAGSLDANLKKTIQHIESAADKGAQIICLQELFRSHYFCQQVDDKNFALAESVPGPSTEALSQVAQNRNIVIVVPLFEKRAEGVYHNSAVVIDADGSLLGSYRKMHIPDDPNFYEKFYFSPGDSGFKAFETRYGKIGVLICWDQWFPEAARMTALQGAQILFYPTAIGWHDSESEEARKAQLEAWQTIQRSHAIANEIFVASVNRTGKEGAVQFWGRSFVAGPFGEILTSASQDSEEILLADCALRKIEETRQSWPFLRDRRIDAYRGITERFLDGKASAPPITAVGRDTAKGGKSAAGK